MDIGVYGHGRCLEVGLLLYVIQINIRDCSIM